jgi:glycine/D-amino acid oxidase-like deaminating enzyme
MQHYQAIGIDAGAMGSAVLFHLARRGRRVLGLKRFDIPHHFGSSHGITRIIRLVYYVHASYVPFLPQVIIAPPCSGHGFKFSSVIGEILADLVMARETRHDTTMFGLERFSFN